MKVLGIDCSTGWTGVGLFLDGAVTVDVNYFVGRKQSSLLPILVEDALERTALAPVSLDAVAVTVGPGSFTGIKVGLSYACALAEGAGKKVVPISSLLALGAPFLDGVRLLIPLIRARKGQVYFSIIKGERRFPLIASPPGIMPVDDLVTMEGMNSTHFTVADEDPHLHQDLAESRIPSSLNAFIRGGSVALLGALFLSEAVDPGEARTKYIREPDTGPDR
ncbi:MAG: tRNA (adenosine(37)-N6)-threonylcarbamoyltransferase complex dimerization subunit type 1 TsaB [Thermovirga sp.]|nr:tRNA (adenosine(37)-N6)-threonylcarbamoyltransferase complex dimerization subunit type 1 TsaB [Thermovirga sp.]